MKFYKEIIGISKDAPNPPLTMTFSSSNGFEFDNNFYLAPEKKLSLDGNGGSAILFRNSGITIDDLSNHGLRFSGNNRTILFDFSNGNIEATSLNLGPSWNLGSSENPLNNIYSTNGHFDNIFLSPSPSSTITSVTVNVTNLNITPTNPVTLPKNSEISVSDSESLDIAGARTYYTLTDNSHYIKMRTTSSSDWTNTGLQVKWQTIMTTGSGQACFQFFAKIDISGLSTYRTSLLIPPPPPSVFSSPFTWDALDPLQFRDDVFQLTYSEKDTIPSTDKPAISTYMYEVFTPYLIVTKIQHVKCLYIKITRFK